MVNDGSSKNIKLDKSQNITTAARVRSERWWQEGTVLGCRREQVHSQLTLRLQYVKSLCGAIVAALTGCYYRVAAACCEHSWSGVKKPLPSEEDWNIWSANSCSLACLMKGRASSRLLAVCAQLDFPVWQSEKKTKGREEGRIVKQSRAVLWSISFCWIALLFNLCSSSYRC